MARRSRGRPGGCGQLRRCRASREGCRADVLLGAQPREWSSLRDTDRATASSFARGAESAGIRRLVYLGGLYPEQESLSAHLESQREVGEILLASGVPAVVLQAAVILGSGSASFEMLRHLTERLPIMVTPRWIDTRMQPIAIRDVLHYLVGAADIPLEVNRAYDIGGPDVVTYRQLIQIHARAADLPPRRILSVPVMSPRLSSLWVGLVTPVPSSIARPLVDSLVHEVVSKERDIARWVPDPPDGLIGVEQAISLALTRIREFDVATTWSSADPIGAPSEPLLRTPTGQGATCMSMTGSARSRRPQRASGRS